MDQQGREEVWPFGVVAGPLSVPRPILRLVGSRLYPFLGPEQPRRLFPEAGTLCPFRGTRGLWTSHFKEAECHLRRDGSASQGESAVLPRPVAWGVLAPASAFSLPQRGFCCLGLSSPSLGLTPVSFMEPGRLVNISQATRPLKRSPEQDTC